MEIVEIRTYSGRNIFSHKPTVKMTVDLGDLTSISTKDIEGFNDKLLQWFPGLKTHCCSTGYEGGFVERLQEGTFFSHVTEHLALELQCIMGYEVYFGKTRIIEEPSLYYIVYEYINECCAADFGRTAAEIVSALARNEAVAIKRILDDLKETVLRSELGPSTRAIWDEAIRRHIPVKRIGEESLLQLGNGKYLRLIEASLLDATSCIAVDLAKNKQLTKEILQQHGIPVPRGSVVESEDKAVLVAEQLGYPVVVKPFDGNQGKGVTTNIGYESLLRKAYRLANSYTDRVIVEKFIRGKDYRILVVGDQVSAVAERLPPYIVGDEVHSIKELVAEENRNPNRGTGHERPLTKIKLDQTAKVLLARSGLTEHSIPTFGEIIYLRENGNLSTGGWARDCTREIHPLNKALAVKAARVIGLEIAGIDVIMDDISQPLTYLNGAITEVNAAPGLRMHLYPSEGQVRNVAADILNYMYPPGTPFSVPIISITGTNGKTTVTRMVRHILSLTGKKVGMTCSSGTYIGDECILKGDNTGPVSAGLVLLNKEVDIAVLETARGGIIRQGLGYDLADVGVVVNISEDHLGLAGVNTLEDLAYVKALVVEAIKPQGYAVLNADDSMTEFIAQAVRCNIIYFSGNRNNPIIEHHIIQGGIAVVAENDMIMIYKNCNQSPVIGVREIPITFDGKVMCNIENTLAAVASLLAVGVPDHIIQLGLMSFTSDPVINTGRFNLFDLGTFQVMLDYAHNPSGYKSVIGFLETLNSSRLVGIIGMPGDRTDQIIYQVGQMCGQVFSKIYIKEDSDLRGRKPGEVAGLLYQGAESAGIDSENIEIILPELDALKSAIYTAIPGDLIVMFYQSFEPAHELVQKYINQLIQPIHLFSNEAVKVPIAGWYSTVESAN